MGGVAGRLILHSRLPTIVGLVVALAWPLLFVLVPGQMHQDVTNARQDEQILALEWCMTAVVAIIVIYWERLPFFASVGLRRPSWRDVLAVAIALAAIIAVIAAVAFVLHGGATFSVADPAKVKNLPLGLRIGLVFTAGICEEILFRGYAIERFTALTGKLWLGGFAAIVLFTLGHVARYGLSVGLLGVAIIAIFLTLIYVRRRNLWPCIATHWIIDGLPLLVAPQFVHGRPTIM